MKGYRDNTDFLVFLLRWKKPIIISGVLAFALSAIFSSSFFIDPLYKSYSVVYPSNLNSYSDETPTEQMLQIFESNEIRDNLIETFDLGTHYGLDSTAKYYRTELYEQYADYISFSKTEYESVMIEVLDKDPQLACDLVKHLLKYFNSKARGMHRANEYDVLMSYKDQMEVKQIEMDTLEAQVKRLRIKYGLLDYKAQAKNTTKEYVKLVSGTSVEKKNAESLTPIINSLEEKGGEFISKNFMLDAVREDYKNAKLNYDEALKQYNRDIKYASEVVSPIPADKKSYPVRWLIVVLSVFGGVLLTILVAATIESLKEASL